MNILLLYDITHDGTRTRIADTCLDYGLDRVQYSAFAGWLSRNHQEELMLKVTGLLGRKRGVFSYFRSVWTTGTVASNWTTAWSYRGRLNMLDNHNLLTVTDLKQFDYCPRVVFYEQCLPHVRPRTYKMDVGRDVHEEEQRRAARRTLHAYGEVAGERHFDVAIHSETLGFVGLMDEIVFTADGRIFPVDYKLAKHARRNYKVQLAAYALLLEEAHGVTVTHGYLYLIPLKKLVNVPITDHLRNSVHQRLQQASQMIVREQMPAPTNVRSRCRDCEFRRFCNDV
ncbi:MAG: CRISPR-associated protein Cas4 [Chloroflexota bacterium]